MQQIVTRRKERFGKGGRQSSHFHKAALTSFFLNLRGNFLSECLKLPQILSLSLSAPFSFSLSVCLSSLFFSSIRESILGWIYFGSNSFTLHLSFATSWFGVLICDFQSTTDSVSTSNHSRPPLTDDRIVSSHCAVSQIAEITARLTIWRSSRSEIESLLKFDFVTSFILFVWLTYCKLDCKTSARINDSGY